MVLNDLSNALYNAGFKCFARSQKARQDAYNVLRKHGFPGRPPEVRSALRLIVALTEEEVDNFHTTEHKAIMAAFEGPPGKKGVEPFSDTTPEEIIAEIESYLQDHL